MSAAGRTIVDALARSVADHGDRRAVDDGSRVLTYVELGARVHEVAAALVASGIGTGDVVSLWAPNSVEWIEAFLGIEHAGATLVPINTRFKGREAADILARSRAKALITVDRFLDVDYVAMLRATGVELPDLETVVAIGSTAHDDVITFEELLARADDASREEAKARAAAVTVSDVSDILFTSGTTGQPKGVVQTHDRTMRVADDWVVMAGLQPGDVYLMVNPYFHMFGLKAGILASVAAGATMLPEPVFDISRVLKRVQDEKVTVLPGAPTIYQAMLDAPDRASFDISTLRVAVTGSADIPVELIRRIFAELPFTTVVSGYGLTEAGTATGTGHDDDATTVATTVGRARPGFELRLVDSDGREVPTGEPGEVTLRGGSVMSHYLDNPEATAAALTADGWLHTGDLGVIEPNGCLRIVGRVKDMFIVGGFNAYPAEIENVLLRHDAVQQVAVIGIPDDRLGEVGMAFVVTQPGAQVTEAELIAWSRDEMANYKVPRRVAFLDALPINATGKVVKDELRAHVSR
ncbi:MAG TPA: FadD3 family acyl-CoA ligase [Mycobacteriales bacterium]|nr:FadD3 family acyl-CoA ligase [Mycobacteriales bacterium]